MSQPPQATTVRRRWPGDPGAPGGRQNRVGFDYDAHVPGPIAAWEPLLPAALATDNGRVENAIRTLLEGGAGLDALLWPLLRTEAIASSRIEGLSVSQHRLALARTASTSTDALATSVLGNLDALRRALDLSDAPIAIEAFESIHRTLLENTAQAAIAGRIRASQNWIGGRHPNPRGAAFVPPPEDRLDDLLRDLCAFCERDDLPPLVQAAIAHVQFESIHPFADGNGRVGRALIHIVLARRGLTRRGHEWVLPPVSLALAARSDAYIEGLTAFRAGRPDEWLAFFLEAVYASTAVAETLRTDVTDLQHRWRARAGHPRSGSAAAALIAHLPESPVIDLRGAVALTGAGLEANRKAIARLEDARALTETTGLGRRRRWEATELFAVLDELETSLRPPVRHR